MTLPPELDEPIGATPLDPEDAAQLIPTWVATRSDLDTVEQENIAKAMVWAASRDGLSSIGVLLSERTMLGLHRKMFDEVWKWAGAYRQRDTNMGAHWPYVGTQVRDLLANGNGRHARLAGDLLVRALGRPVFSWGSENLNRSGQARTRYLDALRAADASFDYEPLTAFARS